MTPQNIKVRGTLSDDPLHSGCTWLHLDDSCKIHLSATETLKYLEWRESITRDSQNTDSSAFEDPTASFFKSLTSSSSVPTSLDSSPRSTSPALRKASKKVRNARLQLYENLYVLDRAPPKLRVGELDVPDSLGWRWYQCKSDVQVLLPPDAGVQYSTFLMLEGIHLSSATSCKVVQRFNKARERFNELCVQSQRRHPVRGIASTARRYALPVGFRCSSIDKLIGRPQDNCEYLMPEEMPNFTQMLSEADVYRRRWLSIGSDSRVLLPADTAAQLAFLCRNGVSQPTHPLMRRILTDFRCLSSEITAEGLLATQKPRLSMFPLESHSQTLDEAVAHIEVNISRSTRKQVKHTCLHPRWRGVVHELGEQVDFPSSSSHSYFGSEELRGTLSPRVVRRLVRRHGRRNLKAGNVDKELPPLPPESEERTVSPRERATVNRDKIWIHRKTRILT